MRRFTSVAVVVAAIIVCAAATVWAAHLKPVKGSPFPHASGSVSTTYTGPYSGWGNTYYNAYTSIAVSGLAPTSEYELHGVCYATKYHPVDLLIAGFGTDGSGNCSETYLFLTMPPAKYSWYYVVDANGDAVLR